MKATSRSVALTAGLILLSIVALSTAERFVGPSTGPSAAMTKDSTWESGYAAKYTISAGGSALSGWRLEFDLPPGTVVRVLTYRDSLLTSDGNHYTFTHRDHNKDIAANATASFDFKVNGRADPVGCLLNGQPCIGGSTSTGAVTTTSATAPPTESGSLRAAPYYLPLDNNPQDIGEAIRVSGQKSYIFAFVLAPGGGGCTPVWDGDSGQPVSGDTTVKGKVDQVRRAGGDVSVSFGGYNGLELGATCADAVSLAAAYQTVIDKYSLTHIDLDIEGDDLGDVTGETKRFQAVKILKQNNPNLHVSLTLPVTTVGLSDLGKAEIQRAKDIGAVIDLYKVMAFDYGGPAASMAADVRTIMGLVHDQLKTLRPDLGDAAVFRATGLILMNGHTDQPSELFTVDAFRDLLGYVRDNRLGRFSYWALNRDRQCTGNVGRVDGKCSSVTQQPYDFTKIIAEYQN